MSSIAVFTCFYDASALAKKFADEEHSDTIEEIWKASATRYTTPFCFHETLGVLKLKWKRALITKDINMAAVTEATTWYRAATRDMPNPDITDTDTFVKAFELVKKYDLDFSDACQIVSVKYGYYRHAAYGSKTLFVTADGDLVTAARTEKLRVFHVGKDTLESIYKTEPSPFDKLL